MMAAAVIAVNVEKGKSVSVWMRDDALRGGGVPRARLGVGRVHVATLTQAACLASPKRTFFEFFSTE